VPDEPHAVGRTAMGGDLMEPRVPEPPGSPRLLRPRSVGELLTDAFELYRRHWQNLFLIVAVIAIPLSFLQVLVGDFWIRQGLTEEELRNGVEVTVNGAFVGGILASFVVAITSILMWTVLTGAITRAAAGTFLGRDLDIGESYRYGFARFWSIVLVGLLSGLAIAVGFLLLIVPGFIVLTFLTCAIPALVIEDKRGREALRRSWNLVRGRGWPVFGTILVAFLINGIVNSLLTAPFGDNWAARSIGASIASIITMPYMALVGVFIYLDVRVRKEQYSAAELERDLASSGG
jgi:MFS family permease